MKNNSLKTSLSAAFLLLALSACGNTSAQQDDPLTKEASPLGAFQSASCFKNKMATQGFGQDVFTRATMAFRSDGTATNTFELYTDQACITPDLQGTGEIQYVFLKKIGAVTVIQIDQLNDPNDPNSNVRYWILGVLSQDGYIMDIEFASGESGPYETEPGETEAAAFLANINARGVFFRRQ